MPKKIARRRATKKRTYKKRTNRLARKMPLSTINLGLGFPDKVITKLRYTEAFSLSPAASQLVYNDFIANGLFDVNLEAGGHQPYYFDQFMTLYNHYKVLGSKITLRITPTAVSEDPCFLGVYLNDDDTHTPADVQSYQEIGGNSCHRMTPPGMNSTQTFSCTFSNKKVFRNLKTDDLIGTSTANPAETQVYTVYAYPVGANGCSFYVQVTIEYICEFFEKKDIAGS